VSFTLPGGLGFLNGARLPTELAPAGGVPINAPFLLYAPITMQPTNLVPLEATFDLYTPITITVSPEIAAPFSLRN
jgi:hypothetical protein